MATILVVDDREPNRAFLTSLLGYRNHRMLEAGDGAEALSILLKMPVDLVISDILMPTMDGYELVRRMRETEATAHLPVMFFTAHYNELEARNLAKACGVARVLTKPAEPERVLQAVDELLANKVPPPPPLPEQFDEEHLRVVNSKLVEMTDELRSKTTHMAALLDMNLQLASERDPEKLLSGFCRSARELAAARHVIVAVHAADGGPLRHVTIAGMEEQIATAVEAALRRDGAFADRLGDTNSIRRTFEDGDPATAGLPVEHPPVHSLIVAPIRSLAHVYGWVCTTGKLGLAAFTEEDERLLTIFAAQVGRIYENGSLYADMKRQADELRREVAGRQLAQAALGRSEERFRYLFLNSPLPMWVYSLATLKFLEVNDEAVAAYGYSRDEFLAMTLFDIRPPEEIDRLKSWFADPPPIDNLHATSWRHRRKTGQLMDVEVYLHDIEFDGQPARLALAVDITARKRTERESRGILETSQDVIAVTDSYGRFLQISPSAANVFGYQPEEMIGRLGADFIAPEDLEITRNEMRAARRGSATRNFRTRYRHKDGHLVPLVWMADWSEPDRRHFFIGRDMTEYERTEEQLRQAQKMESVGQLTGGLAHDFNNILMVIMANAEELGEEELPPHVLERIGGISNATQRAADLTRQLLAFSRKQPLRPQRININDLVAATGKLLRRTLGEQIEIQSILAGDLWDAEIDRAQLESALVNLSINARDAMPNGGHLLIETSNATLDDDYVLQDPDAAAGDYVILAVTDTGTGMPPDVLDKVFEPFFTTKGVGKGTGLGLSMVYGFIKQSKGHIKIYSEIGRGTSIRLYLPRSDGAQEEIESRRSPSIPRGAERVLVVEDDPQVRASVVRQLQSLGYAVVDVSDGPSALAAFEAAAQPYDLLLTDVIMPGPMNGKMLANEVAIRSPDTKVVFMSGYTENAIIHQGRLDGGVLLLSKPFRKQDLAEILRQALDGTGKVDR
jgi:PAS domain S-box-containing protein